MKKKQESYGNLYTSCEIRVKCLIFQPMQNSARIPGYLRLASVKRRIVYSMLAADFKALLGADYERRRAGAPISSFFGGGETMQESAASKRSQRQ